MQPIGIELVKKGVVTEADINKALDYQKTHPNKKIGDIIKELGLCDPTVLINAMGEILNEKAINLGLADVQVDPTVLINAMGEILNEKAINLGLADVQVDLLDYMSLDVAKQNRVIPFAVESGKIKVCFSDLTNKRKVENVRLLLLNKGLIMDKYITFDSNIESILNSLEGTASDNIDTSADISGLLDSIIKTAMEKRASDIHIEPMENEVRVRYRIDGHLTTMADIDKEKQTQLIGRLKAISNMHQEKQEAQDGRILMYPAYNIRVSSQRNVWGEKFVLRLLKKNVDVQQIFELGFPRDEELVKKSFDKRNSITLVAAPTGEGKTTTLYSIIDFLNKPDINVTTIEDPVEIRIPGLNQIEIDSRTSFSDSLRTVLRQDPDIILVGEIRDRETAEIAMQAGQTGHYVLSTIHTIDSIEVITRLRKMGVSDYDISSTLATSMSQRLVRKVCPNCAQKREFTQQEKEIINNVAKKYGIEYNFEGKYTYDIVGCKHCNETGFYGRIGIFEVLNINDTIKDLIVKDRSTLEIRAKAIEEGYRPLVIDGFNKVLDGYTTLEELNSKLGLY